MLGHVCLSSPCLQGSSPPALCCSAVYSYVLLPQAYINHCCPNLCSCTSAKVISTMHILRELFLSPEQPDSTSAGTALSARLKMLYQSTLVFLKESAEEGKKLMEGCQTSCTEFPRKVGQRRSSFPPAWAPLHQRLSQWLQQPL